MLYTIIYDFMWRDLRLRCAEKEVFAVIAAKRNLLDRKLIAAHETRGKPSRYEVLIPDPLENRTGADSERGPVRKSNDYPSGNYTGAESAPKINSYKKNKQNEFNYGTFSKNQSNCVSSREQFDSADKE